MLLYVGCSFRTRPLYCRRIKIKRLGLDSLRTRLIAQRVLRISWSESTIYKFCTHLFCDRTVRP